MYLLSMEERDNKPDPHLTSMRPDLLPHLARRRGIAPFARYMCADCGKSSYRLREAKI